MDDLSNKCCCVYDHGEFFHVAQRLARDFGRTLYFKPWKKSNPVFQDFIVGTGFDGVERIENFFDHVDEVDLFVFPALYDGDLQLHLESLGKRVWGSRRGEEFEFKREFFKNTLKKLGLKIPPFKVCEGFSELKKYLESKSDLFVKISRFRGDGETWRHINFKLSESKLDRIALYYDAFKEDVRFIVEDEIPTQIEVAYDGFCVDGKFPDYGIHGYEIKNLAYIATLQKYDEMPESVREINDAFALELKRVKYRSLWGTEIRVSENGDNFFIDATCRTPAPPGAIEAEQITNYSEIMWLGSVGELVQIKFEKMFAAELEIVTSSPEISFQALEIPENVQPMVKLYSPAKRDGIIYAVREIKHPLMEQCDEIGSVVGLGDTIEEAVEDVKKNAEAIVSGGVEFDVQALYRCLEEIHSAEEKGMEFSDDKIPEPQTALEDSE